MMVKNFPEVMRAVKCTDHSSSEISKKDKYVFKYTYTQDVKNQKENLKKQRKRPYYI